MHVSRSLSTVLFTSRAARYTAPFVACIFVAAPFAIFAALEASANARTERALALLRSGVASVPSTAPSASPLEDLYARLDFTWEEVLAIDVEDDRLVRPDAVNRNFETPEEKAAHPARASALDRLERHLPALDEAAATSRVRAPLPLGHVSLVKLIRGAMAHATLERRDRAAWDHFERMLRYTLAIEPVSKVGWLVRTGYLVMVCERLEVLLARAPIDGARAARIASLLEGCAAERLLGPAARLDYIESLAAHSASDAGLELVDRTIVRTESGEVREPLRPFARLPRPYRRLVFLEDRALLAELGIEAADILDRPLREMQARGALLDQRVNALGWDRHPLTRYELGDTSAIAKRAALLEAHLRVAHIALALAVLEDLPEKLPLHFADPFAPGALIRWKKTGPTSGFLWSVGTDGVDDGGMKAPGDGESWTKRATDVVFELHVPG